MGGAEELESEGRQGQVEGGMSNASEYGLPVL